MARIRSLKPELWEDEKFGALSLLGKVVFIGCICFADDEGRLRGAPDFLRTRLFPYQPTVDVTPALAELATSGRIIRYLVNHEELIEVVNFKKHQRIDKPSKSQLSPSTLGALLESSRALPVGLEGSDGKGVEQKVSLLSPSATRQFEELFAYWQEKAGHPNAKPDEKRKRAVTSRLKEGRTLDDLKLAVDGCLQTPHNMGENERGEVYDDLELICRDGSHVDRFMRNAKTPPKVKGNGRVGESDWSSVREDKFQ